MYNVHTVVYVKCPTHSWVRMGFGKNITLMSNFEYFDDSTLAYENTDHDNAGVVPIAKRSLEVKRKTTWRNWLHWPLEGHSELAACIQTLK